MKLISNGARFSLFHGSVPMIGMALCCVKARGDFPADSSVIESLGHVMSFNRAFNNITI